MARAAQATPARVVSRHARMLESVSGIEVVEPDDAVGPPDGAPDGHRAETAEATLVASPDADGFTGGHGNRAGVSLTFGFVQPSGRSVPENPGCRLAKHDVHLQNSRTGARLEELYLHIRGECSK